MGYMMVCTNPHQVLIFSFLVYDFGFRFSTSVLKEEVKANSCVTKMYRYMWYVFESRSLI